MANEFSADNVIKHLEALSASGVFRDVNPADEWEAGTEWHPRHIGDRRIGKYQDILHPSEITQVNDAVPAFIATFTHDGR